MLRWRLYIEEYSPEIRYVKGEVNVVADALSRLDKTEERLKETKEKFYTTCYGIEDSRDKTDMYPLKYAHFQKEQDKDELIQKVLGMENTKYIKKIPRRR